MAGRSRKKKFIEDTKDMKYVWKTDKQISIDDVLYDIDLKHNEMTLKNENVEIHYKNLK